MIVACRLGNPNPDQDLIEEGWLRQLDACATEVVPRMERELVDPCLDSIAGEQRRVGPAVRIGRGGGNLVPRPIPHQVHLHANAGRGEAARRIEDMG